MYNGKVECLLYELNISRNGDWPLAFTKIDKRYSDTKKDDFIYPIKVVDFVRPYNGHYIGSYSVLTLKHYNKETMKATTKGMTADRYTNHKGEVTYWDFGGFTASSLKHICKVNGYVPKEGDQYGHYAEWWMKL